MSCEKSVDRVDGFRNTFCCLQFLSPGKLKFGTWQMRKSMYAECCGDFFFFSFPRFSFIVSHALGCITRRTRDAHFNSCHSTGKTELPRTFSDVSYSCSERMHIRWLSFKRKDRASTHRQSRSHSYSEKMLLLFN